MTITAKIGEMSYEFVNVKELSRARELYVKCVGNQEQFETDMETAGIDFCYDIWSTT